MIECLESCPNLAISLEYLKNHLRLDDIQDMPSNLPQGEDYYLEELIRAAQGIVENYTGRTLLYKTWKLSHTAEDVPHEGAGPRRHARIHTFALPHPPLVRIVEVRDMLGMDGDARGRVIRRYMLTPNGTLPIISVWSPHVEVTYQTGYGDTPLQVPAPLRQAVTHIVAEMYSNRTNANISIQGMLKEILDPYRIVQAV